MKAKAGICVVLALAVLLAAGCGGKRHRFGYAAPVGTEYENVEIEWLDFGCSEQTYPGVEAGGAKWRFDVSDWDALPPSGSGGTLRITETHGGSQTALFEVHGKVVGSLYNNYPQCPS
jgi:hypothetical protein